MTDTNNNETNQDVHIDPADLENLPEKERKETKEILDDIASGGKKPSAPADTAEKAPDEKDAPAQKPKDEEKAKADTPKPEEKLDAKKDDKKPEEDPNVRRSPKLVPAWMLKTQEDQATKREAELKKQLEEAIAVNKAEKKDGAEPDEANELLDKKITTIAEKSGLDPEVLKELVALATPKAGVTLPPDVADQLKQLKEITTEREVAVEAARYSEDFTKLVVPLIKAEYGDDVPAETIEKIKEELKKVAYDPDYAKVPFITIYRGRDEFRGVIPPKVKGAEKNRGGTVNLADASKVIDESGVDWEQLASDDSYEVSDSVLRKLSGDDIDRYGDLMQKREQKQRSARTAEGGR